MDAEERTSYDKIFAENVAILKEYVLKNGRLPEANAMHKGKNIGRWMLKQRSMHNNKRMSAWRKEQLESIKGWKWHADDPFPEKLALLKEFIKLTGGLPKTDVKYRGCSIGKWASLQRSAFFRGELSVRRVMALESISEWKWQKNSHINGFQSLQD